MIIVTHDGKFHADEVCAVAALLLLFKGARVVRTRDKEIISRADIVVDVGEKYDAQGNRFDHHQKEGAGARTNKIPFASFGLVWQKFGEQVAGGGKAARLIDEVFISPLDARDNGVSLFTVGEEGVYPYEFSDVIHAFNPTWQESETVIGRRFDEATAFAGRIFMREVERAKAKGEGDERVERAYQDAADKRLIILDEDYSWKHLLAQKPEPLFAVHPQGALWYVKCVRSDPNSFINRKNLPAAWAGLRAEELSLLTGVSDAIFCHRNLFLAVAKTKEGVLQLAKLALAG